MKNNCQTPDLPMHCGLAINWTILECSIFGLLSFVVQLYVMTRDDHFSRSCSRDDWNPSKNIIVTKAKISPKLNCRKNLKCHTNQNVTKAKISPKLKCRKNLKCHTNRNVTKTETSSKLKLKKKKICNKIWY